MLFFQIEDNSTYGLNGMDAKNFKHHWVQLKYDVWNAMLGTEFR